MVCGALMLSSASQTAAQRAPVERDSAGIRIVANASRATLPVAFRLGVPSLTLGGPMDDPSMEFSARNSGGIGAFRMQNGDILVSDHSRLQVFDARGKRVGVIGRSGAGPQELQAIYASTICQMPGDTLVVLDQRNGRFALVSGRKIVKTALLRDVGNSLAGCFSDGSLLFRDSWFTSENPTYPVRLSRAGSNGIVLQRFSELTFRAPHPVTHMQTAATVVHRDRVYVGAGETSEVRVYDASGRLIRIIRTADALKPVSMEYLSVALKGNRQPQYVKDIPKALPAYSQLRTDPAGRLWMQDFSERVPEREMWTAFDVQGRAIGRLSIPRMINGGRSMVVNFGADEVQLMHTDADGFVQLSFYPIVRTR
jgi:hypothetical protein